MLFLLPIVASAREVHVLFSGNSFIYYSNLPELVKMMAEDRGHTFKYTKSLRGGSSLFGLMNNSPSYGFVDNLMNDSLSFDYVVMQDMSRLPTVLGAREKLMMPTFERVAGLTKGMGKDTKIISYMTWGYNQVDTRFLNTDQPINRTTVGTPRPNFRNGCPTPMSKPDFHAPYGNLPELTPDCMFNSTYNETVKTKDCMQYTLARGYTDTLRHGADWLAPCGLAWQIVRGEEDACEEGREIVDAQYDYDLPYEIPFSVELSEKTRETLKRGIELQLDNGRNNHQDFTGQYLNALIFYTMIFGEDPEGLPNYSLLRHDRTNDDPPTWFWDYNNETWVEVPEGKAAALQEVASKLVYDNLDFWRDVMEYQDRYADDDSDELEALRKEVAELRKKNSELEFVKKLLMKEVKECEEKEDKTCENMLEGWPKSKRSEIVFASNYCDCETQCKKLKFEGYVFLPKKRKGACQCISGIKKPIASRKVKRRDGKAYYQLIEN